MTEAEWLNSTEPDAMLAHLRGQASDRKLRLFACACCRRVEYLLTEDYVRASRAATGLWERQADDEATEEEVDLSKRDTNAEWYDSGNAVAHPAEAAYYAVAEAVTAICSLWRNPVVLGATKAAAIARAYDAFAKSADDSVAELTRSGQMAQLKGASEWRAVEATVKSHPLFVSAMESEYRIQCDQLRDIFGNPFQRVMLNPLWLSPAVVQLARTIYDERAFERMAELAVALTAAGCTNDEILEHCRGTGPHVRGCWVVDLILESES